MQISKWSDIFQLTVNVQEESFHDIECLYLFTFGVDVVSLSSLSLSSLALVLILVSLLSFGSLFSLVMRRRSCTFFSTASVFVIAIVFFSSTDLNFNTNIKTFEAVYFSLINTIYEHIVFIFYRLTHTWLLLQIYKCQDSYFVFGVDEWSWGRLARIDSIDLTDLLTSFLELLV